MASQIVSSPESTTGSSPAQQSVEETPEQSSTANESTAPRNIRKRTTIQDAPRPTTPESNAPRRSFTRGRTLSSMLVPEKKIGPAPGFFQSIRSIILASWLNILLVFIPVSWALNFTLKDAVAHKDTIVFIMSFLAIIPLAKLLAFATDELSMRVGQTLAGLLNATLGNAVELIVAIIALTKCELRVVQASLVGSVLSNLLLVLGMCFFAGGLKYSEQGFGASATQLNSSLLTISVIAVLLPAAFHLGINSTDASATPDTKKEGADILALSRGVSIILLFIYCGYLVFQLYSHKNLYQDTGDHVMKTIHYAPEVNKMKKIKFFRSHKDEEKADDVPARTASPTQETQETNSTTHDLEKGERAKEEEEEIPQLNLWMTAGLLVVVTVLVAVTAEWLVDSIDGLTESGGISKEFVGIILLPIVGNAAEHVTAVTVSVKDKLTLSLGVAVGSSIQIALFVIPFIITLAWILGKPLTLLFDPYESITLFLAVLTVNYVVQDGRSNWLEGMILMCLYLILGVTFWFYPGSDPSGVLSQCIR
ncbi:putative Ca(2) cation antiporter (CaCA) (TC 2.A.19) family protein [Lyophyllum shimeji]|uniref:Ca(2) cation antiporter (CaCA) (TC 2.A.19) family protein n=1 Tax=Lyophyllum shimeji TaxID=47721 RepID=A0A9P3PPE1_LYOSH|nr:putative Ca(2) cation antiporter (CaCA) (TC 2.A.19) family protein [Lyophyllum shimeji]